MSRLMWQSSRESFLEISETIKAKGHENILATHPSTFEITKEPWLTKRGDCIIAVDADKGCSDLSRRFKDALRSSNAHLTILIEAGGIVDVVNAYGCPNLILDHPEDMVVRKSSYVCRRTLAIYSDKAAADLSRRLVAQLRVPGKEVNITLTVRF
ncbi:MAG: DUF371 domain-containing protein [Nitrososphaerota archaeon]|nr:DUF371 domain-containing protein [Nitrososphaerota archaeon]